MSRDFDQILQDILGSSKNLDTNSSLHDLLNIKNYFNIFYTKLDKISQRLNSLEEKIDHIFDVLNTFQVMLEDEYDEIKEDDDDLYGNKEWTPYDDDNEYDDYGDYDNSDEDEEN